MYILCLAHRFQSGARAKWSSWLMEALIKEEMDSYSALVPRNWRPGVCFWSNGNRTQTVAKRSPHSLGCFLIQRSGKGAGLSVTVTPTACGATTLKSSRSSRGRAGKMPLESPSIPQVLVATGSSTKGLQVEFMLDGAPRSKKMCTDCW